MPAYDAILIPGGGVREGGALPPWVRNRLDCAASLADGAYLITLSAGTPYKPPPLDCEGYPIFEAVAGARYLMARGVDPARILVETSSYDTIGNAYFSRVIHAEPRGLARLLVVTSAFQMARVEAVFRWVYGLTGGASFSLAFETVPDAGLDAAQLASRVAKEQAGLAQLAPRIATIRTLAAFHDWLFGEHTCYAAALDGSPCPEPGSDVLDTY